MFILVLHINLIFIRATYIHTFQCTYDHLTHTIHGNVAHLSVTIGKELQLNTLKAVNLTPPLTRPFSFVYKKQKFRVQAMEELLEFAQQYCKEHQEGPL